MATSSITTETLRRLPNRDVDLWDKRLPGFVVRCRTSGSHSYRVRLGRGRWYTLGPVGVLTLEEARKEAQVILGEQARGGDPIEARRRRKSHTLRAYIAEVYGPWQKANRKTGEETIARIEYAFPELLSLRLSEISAWHVERWRTGRVRRGIAAATINRDVNTLRAALNRAVDWGLLNVSPLAKVKPLPVDSRAIIRYLSPEEEKALRDALIARDEKRRKERAQANAWRRERRYREWPEFGTYTDHLHPIVLLAMNTGMRRGELFKLKWSDVELVGGMLTVRGEEAKNAQTRHIPLNTEAVAVLRAWQTSLPIVVDVGKAGDYVFPSPYAPNQPLDDIKKGWGPLLKSAAIERFRFHDLRHHFASRLVQAGVDLNTVRELLGHSDIKMVLRYAHLAPENARQAVAKLMDRRG